jgi:hypothetical protein
MRKSILVTFSDGATRVCEPETAVRIVNRCKRPGRYRDFEKVSFNPLRRAGSSSFEARILAVGQAVETHRGLQTVGEAAWEVDAPPNDGALSGTAS